MTLYRPVGTKELERIIAVSYTHLSIVIFFNQIFCGHDRIICKIIDCQAVPVERTVD